MAMKKDDGYEAILDLPWPLRRQTEKERRRERMGLLHRIRELELDIEIAKEAFPGWKRDAASRRIIESEEKRLADLKILKRNPNAILDL